MSRGGVDWDSHINMMTGKSHECEERSSRCSLMGVDTGCKISAKLTFLTGDGRRFYFGDICQITIIIGNKKHFLTTTGYISTMANKGGKGCRRRRAERRAMTRHG